MKRENPGWLIALVIGIGLLIGGASALFVTATEQPGGDPSAAATALAAQAAGGLPDGTAAIGESPIDALSTQAAVRRATRPQAGKAAPDFSLASLDGEKVTLSATVGQPVIINFWATWCPPCRNEIPLLNMAVERWGEDDLVILGVNATYLDDEAAVVSFSQEFDIQYPILLDPAGSVTDALYQVENLPMTVFIDPGGTIQWIQVGELTDDALSEAVEKILP